jgi:pyruvate/2-oxoglutarate dehydrogenase complex dihydrolipoamide acyltransferase (E2) component
VAKVTMPQLGESVAEGTVGKWLKQPGDHVAKYEPLLEVITDKVNAEVPSPFEGILKEILVEEGATVPNNAEIAIIEEAGDAASTDAGAGASASAAVSMIAISALLGTVAPSSTRISVRVPSNGDGTSAFTLSVMTSSSGSDLATWSPGFFSHFPTVPSATLSPSWGIVTLATSLVPPLGRPGAGPRDRPRYVAIVSPIRADCAHLARCRRLTGSGGGARQHRRPGDARLGLGTGSSPAPGSDEVATARPVADPQKDDTGDGGQG